MITLKTQLSQLIVYLLCFMLHVRFSTLIRIQCKFSYCFLSNEGCGHCVKIKPTVSEVAQRVQKEKIGLLAAVDATVQKELAQKYEISGFPTLKLFKNGVYVADYEGRRTVDDLYQFMRKNASPKKDEL